MSTRVPSEEILTDHCPSTAVKWDAYPVLSPTSTFPPIKLARGVYYVNAFEP